MITFWGFFGSIERVKVKVRGSVWFRVKDRVRLRARDRVNHEVGVFKRVEISFRKRLSKCGFDAS